MYGMFIPVDGAHFQVNLLRLITDQIQICLPSARLLHHGTPEGQILLKAGSQMDVHHWVSLLPHSCAWMLPLPLWKGLSIINIYIAA